MATQDVLEEHSEPIKFKKWILKVSIHCEGCKKKVKKILQQVQGVFEIDIDVKQHKVTVIGDVDANTLLRKLIKAGKHAELWPVKVDEEQQKKQGKSRKGKEKAIEEQETNEQASKVSGNEKEASCKVEQVHEEPSKNTQEVGAAKVRKPNVSGGVSVTKTDQEPSKSNQGSAAAKAGGDGVGAAKTSGESSVSVKVTEGAEKTCTVDQVVKEAKLEEKKPDNNGREAAQPVAAEEKKGGESDTTNSAGKVGGNAGGNSGKKTKKKGQNGNNTGGEQSSKTPVNIGSQNHEDGPPTGSVAPNHSPPHHPSYSGYPQHYYGPAAAPVYAVSYITSHPMNHTASYYASQPPNAYVYAYSDVPEREAPPPPPSDLDAYPRQPLDSFEIFSDENPNGCSVM